MLEDLKLLIELQTMDNCLVALEKILQEIPVTKNKLDQELGKEEEAVKEQRLKVAELEKEQRRTELDLKTLESTIEKHQQQLTNCKNNKEYDAVQHEIQMAKEKTTKIEEKILTSMEKLEKERRSLAAEEKIYQEKKQGFASKIALFQTNYQEKKGEADLLKTQRNALAAGLKDDLRKKYENLARVRQRLAVVDISKTNCKGCYNELPPQMINEVMSNDKIITCQACSRILYYKAPVADDVSC